MSWTSILTALVLALISAELVFIEAWEPWRALLVVGVGAILMIFCLLGVLLVLAGKKHRKEFLAEFLAATGNALRVILEGLRGR